MRRAPFLVVLGLLAIAIALPITGGQLAVPGSVASPSPSVASGPGATADASPGTSSPGSGPVAAGPTPQASGDTTGPVVEPSPTSETPVEADVPIVPVTRFRATDTTVNRKEVQAILAGTSDRFDAVEVVEADADAILAALDVDRPSQASRLRLARDADALAAHLADGKDRLGFLRADEVTPAVRALAWGGRSLFGVDRVTDAADWKLTARLSTPATFDPAATWTLVAGGDVMLDRGVYDTLVNKGRGADFMFAGGTADITSLVCCSSFGWKVPRLKRTGDGGAVRDLVKSADIALANFENPAPNRFRWHTSGTVFSADPSLIDGLVHAGFDVMGVANNHTGDQGDAGLLQTIKNLRKRGLATSGGGKDLAAARTPALIETHGVTVAILAYDAIAPSYHATDASPGSAPMKAKVVRQDVKAARAAGADVVIVFPHWGVEYRAVPTEAQRNLAHKVIDAGADMIIGNHAHWTAAMEVYKGKPIWYALGNLVFDQTWSAETMEGMTLELTFAGGELLQARIHPHVILDKAQPNLTDPAGDGKRVMDRVFENSADLPW